MDKLKKDNDTLKEELALETKQAMASNSSAAAAQIAKLQDQADTYTRKIEMEKRRIEELDTKGGDGVDRREFAVEVSFFQIYLDKVYCLLTPVAVGEEPEPLRVREHPLLGPYVEELELLSVRDAATLGRVIDTGARQRAVATTRMQRSQIVLFDPITEES